MLLAASAAALSAAAGGCTFRADLDFNGGDVAAHVSLANLSSAEARQQRCCALCAADASCKAAVLAGGTHSPPWHCWLKGQGLRTYFNEHPFPTNNGTAMQTSPDEVAFRHEGLTKWLANGLTYLLHHSFLLILSPFRFTDLFGGQVLVV